MLESFIAKSKQVPEKIWTSARRFGINRGEVDLVEVLFSTLGGMKRSTYICLPKAIPSPDSMCLLVSSLSRIPALLLPLELQLCFPL